MLTPEQIELRRTGITSTDVSAIIGLNPYKSEMAVYLDKIGEPLEVEETEGMWWGNALEPLLAHRYAVMTNSCVSLNDCGRGWLAGAVPRWHCGIIHAATALWAMATPDAFVEPRSDGFKPSVLEGRDLATWRAGWDEKSYSCWLCGLELKTAISRKQVARWGVGGDRMPEEYLIQCQWCMFVTGLKRWDVAALLAGYHGAEFRVYTLHRDDELIAALAYGTTQCPRCEGSIGPGSSACPHCGKFVWMGAERWRHKYVLARKPPPPGGLPIDRQALACLHAYHTEDIRLADASSTDLLTDYAVADAEFQLAKAAREKAQQLLKAKIGGAAGLEIPGGPRATWKLTKAGHRMWHFHDGG